MDNSDGTYQMYDYTLLNQQAVMYSNGEQINYTYKPDGLRHSVEMDGETKYQYWSGSQLAYEEQGDDETTYYLSLETLGRKVNDENPQYYLYNAHGDVVQLTQADASVVYEYDYDTFGNQLVVNENDNNPLRYNGQYWDEETQTYYLRARQYNPVTGRFTTEDTHWTVGNMIYDENGSISLEAMLQAGNLYAYCMGNPVGYSDPSGKLGAAVIMLEHAFSKNGEFQDYSNNKTILATFNSSDVIQNKINEKFAEFKKSGLSTNTITGDDLSFYEKSNLADYDLSFAVGKAEYTMTFNKIEETHSFLIWHWEETKYNVTITITDKYNFEYWEDKTISALLNNWGYNKQEEGQIKPFEWEITFTVEGLE